MFFWRAKKDRSEAVRPADQEAGPLPAVAVEDSPTTVETAEEPESNVVTLTPSRLSDRLADRLAQTSVRNGAHIEDAVVIEDAASPPQELVAAAQAVAKTPALPGQHKAFDVLRQALSSARTGHHVLVLGPCGTGRRSALKQILAATLPAMPRPKDWVYVAGGGDVASKAYPLPAGEGVAFAREVKIALAHATSVLERLLHSDDYAIGLQVLDEEFKQTHDAAFEVLKRRAETQNIALVKTPDGYVLAPMHDGRVVKTEVFRSLPEVLQRNVENKISGLEDELKSLIAELPGREAVYSEKIGNLNKEVAHRAVVPQLAGVRALFAGSAEAADALDALEDQLIRRVIRRLTGKDKAHAAGLLDVELVSLQTTENSEPLPPVVTAWDVTPQGLAGLIGLDDEQRLALQPGALMRANGGFLIVEAWRLVAEPGAWQTLSSALEQGAVRPLQSPSLVTITGALPLSVRLILVTDEESWRRLEALDPGIARHFSSMARFQATAPKSDAGETAFLELANALGHARSLAKVGKDALRPLYDDAVRRAGRAGHVSLDLATLGHILAAAGEAAEKAGAREIRPTDIESAVQHRAAWSQT